MPLAALLALIFAATGCETAPGVEVRAWTLMVPDQAPASVELPARLDVPDRRLRFRLEAAVDIPADWRDQALSLSVSQWFADARLLVDGQAVVERAPSAFDDYRGAGQHVFAIPPSMVRGERVELTLDVDHRWSQSAWLDVVPVLGPFAEGAPWTRFVSAFNRWAAILGFGMLGTIAFTYLVLFLIHREREWYGWLALQTGSAQLYLFFIAGGSEFMGASLEAAQMGFALSVALLASVYATRLRFDLGRPSRWWRLLWLLHVVVALATADPFLMSIYYGPLVVVTLTALVVYQLWITLRLALQKPAPHGALATFASWVCIAVTAPCDAPIWVGLPEFMGGLRLASVGLSVFALIGFAALSGDHLRSLRRADKLNVELTAGLERIEHLNEELQRQIAQRSRQLAEAMTRLAAGAAGPPDLQPGDVINDRYRVEALIGSGAMGAVFRVVRIADGAELAAKILTGVADAAQLARFAREAHVASEIRHPNVVRLVDVDFSTTGFMFLIMELVDGPCLKERNERFGEVPWATAIIAELARGLEAIHGQGIIHRDMKPANVLLTQEDPPAIKITDFGIAGVAEELSGNNTGATVASPLREPQLGAVSGSVSVPGAPAVANAEQAEESDPIAAAMAFQAVAGSDPTMSLVAVVPPAATGTSDTRDSQPRARGKAGSLLSSSSSGASGASGLTHTGVILGTPIYMAPELAHGARFASPSSDVFALGVMAFELLAGARPFAIPLCLAARSGSPLEQVPSVAERCPELAAHLAELIQRALDHSPENRPTASEIAEAFAPGAGPVDRDAPGVQSAETNPSQRRM